MSRSKHLRIESRDEVARVLRDQSHLGHAPCCSCGSRAGEAQTNRFYDRGRRGCRTALDVAPKQSRVRTRSLFPYARRPSFKFGQALQSRGLTIKLVRECEKVAIGSMIARCSDLGQAPALLSSTSEFRRQVHGHPMAGLTRPPRRMAALSRTCIWQRYTLLPSPLPGDPGNSRTATGLATAHTSFPAQGTRVARRCADCRESAGLRSSSGSLCPIA